MPAHAPPHGAPARQYLNAKVTATLLEGMKQLAKEQCVYLKLCVTYHTAYLSF